MAHAFVKTHPVTRAYPQSHDEFFAELNDCAREGLRLAKLVKAWTGAKVVGGGSEIGAPLQPRAR